MCKRWTRAAALTLLAVLLTAAPAFAKTMYVKQAAKLFKSYNTNSKVLGALAADTKVNVLDVKNGWAKVKAGGKGGYVLREALTDQKPNGEGETGRPSKAMYVTEKTKLYKSASTASKAVAALPKGAQVTLKAQSGNWGKVTYGKKNGYIKLAKLSEQPVPAEADDKPTPAPASEEYETLKPGDTGEAVKKLQTRLKALEWFYGDIGGNYKELTTLAVKDFQEAAGLKISGIADAVTQKALHSKDAPRNVINSTAKPVSGKSKEMDWWTSGIQELFPRGATAVVTDVDTGLSWRVQRMGGTNHADVQPVTAQDTAVMKKAYGGAWSWNRRAIWVSVGGAKYAASMNGMPHGSGTIAVNNFGGHHCIHFTNSRTHGTNVVDAMHQAAIKKAAAAG